MKKRSPESRFISAWLKVGRKWLPKKPEPVKAARKRKQTSNPLTLRERIEWLEFRRDDDTRADAQQKETVARALQVLERRLAAMEQEIANITEKHNVLVSEVQWIKDDIQKRGGSQVTLRG